MNKIIILGLVAIVVTVVGLGANMMAENQNQREHELNQSSIAQDRLESIFNRCDCQERVKNNPDTNMLCLGTFMEWENSTHYIDNHLCEIITVEKARSLGK